MFNLASPSLAQMALPTIDAAPTVQESFPSEDAVPLQSSYRLGPGDHVKIDIYGAPQYSTTDALVLSDGTLSLPTAGTVSVQGMTMEQAAAAIARAYGPYLRRAHVTVTPVQLRPVQIGVAGEVNRPGSYTLTQGDDEGERFLTLTEAIELAQGITPRADLRQIQVRRQQQFGSPQITTVNLWELLQTGQLEQDIILQGGDSVYIPTAEAMSPAEIARIGSASFAPDTIRVYVAGEVEQPGMIEVPPNTPLNQALLAAGGFNQRAQDDSVELVRLNPNGTATRQEIEIDLAEGIDPETNPSLQNQDVIVVRRSGLAGASDTANLANPIGGLLRTILGIFF